VMLNKIRSDLVYSVNLFVTRLIQWLEDAFLDGAGH